MKFLVISDAHHIKRNGQRLAYAPYVKEMDLWLAHVDQVHILAPTRYNKNLLSQAFARQDIQVTSLRRLEFHRVSSAVLSLLSLPFQVFQLWNAMRKADHIHLRCPGNLGLLASMVQILFPRKQKTVKYAGNWDPEASQPLAYRWQKAILSNTKLAKNIQILVYGAWPNQSKNVLPFFTASYHRSQVQEISARQWAGPIQAVFVGTLSANKRPMELIDIASQLIDMGVDFYLDFYGNGPLFNSMQERISALGLEGRLTLHGNVGQEVLIEAYQKAHFSFLLSQSEGWPKAVAEAMFWGCIPVATPVSCVPWMLAAEKSEASTSTTAHQRGILIEDLNKASRSISNYLKQPELLNAMSKNAAQWSRQYTLEDFDEAIQVLLKK